MAYSFCPRRAAYETKQLLLVLDRPELPLHNNRSENDIRGFAKLRMINGSSRSDNGRQC
jgi:hypothetical protein